MMKNFLLPSDLKSEIEQNSTTIEVPKKVKIISKGDLMDYVPFIKKGTVRVFIEDTDSKKEQLLYYVGEGETCLMSMIASLGDRISLVSAVTDDNSEIVKVPNDKVRFWQKKHTEWNDLILNLFLKHYWELLETINALSFKKVDERLFNYLQKEATDTGKLETLKTHKQLAKDIGTSREVITRALKKLQQDNKIYLTNSSIQIRK